MKRKEIKIIQKNLGDIDEYDTKRGLIISEIKNIKGMNTEESKEFENEMNTSKISALLTFEENENPTPKEIKFNIDTQKLAKKNLLFEYKFVNPLKLYFHLSYKTEKFLMLIGILTSLFSGVSYPMMGYLTGAATTEGSRLSKDKIALLNNNTKENEKEKEILFKNFEKGIEEKVHLFLYIGTALFIAHFLSNFCWEYSGLRQMHHLKEKYFSVILRQEQAWFDENNVFEFSTKVQAQLEQIELGVGEKFGQISESIGCVVSGLILAFTACWQLTLIILCVTPFLGSSVYLMVRNMRRIIFLSRKAFEMAGGIAEEILYNIKTVASFVHFDYEQNRFNELNNDVYIFDCKGALLQGRSMFFVKFFFIFRLVFACFMHKKH